MKGKFMKKIVFTNVETELHNSQTVWGLTKPNTITEPGPFTITTADHVSPEMAATNYFGNNVTNYDYKIVPVNNR